MENIVLDSGFRIFRGLVFKVLFLCKISPSGLGFLDFLRQGHRSKVCKFSCSHVTRLSRSGSRVSLYIAA